MGVLSSSCLPPELGSSGRVGGMCPPTEWRRFLVHCPHRCAVPEGGGVILHVHAGGTGCWLLCTSTWESLCEMHGKVEQGHAFTKGSECGQMVSPQSGSFFSEASHPLGR